MKYILILSLYHGGITTVPNSYPQQSLCEMAGKTWVDSTGATASYFCTVEYK